MFILYSNVYYKEHVVWHRCEIIFSSLMVKTGGFIYESHQFYLLAIKYMNKRTTNSLMYCINNK